MRIKLGMTRAFESKGCHGLRYAGARLIPSNVGVSSFPRVVHPLHTISRLHDFLRGLGSVRHGFVAVKWSLGMRRWFVRASGLAAASIVAAASGSTRAHCKAPALKKEGEDKEKNTKSGSHPKSIPELVLTLGLRERQVFLNGRVDDEMARVLIATLLYLEHDSPNTPIRLLINSSGGGVQAGLAIHDTMQSISSPVHTLCLGHCESIAALILATGAAGQRAAMPNARVMIHQPVRTGGAASNAKQLSIHAASIEKSKNKLVQILSMTTGMPAKEVERLLEYDTVCDAEEAIALGLIDKVAEPGSLVPTKSTTTSGDYGDGAAGEAGDDNAQY